MPFDEFASGVTTLTGIRKPAAGDDVFSSGVAGDAQDRFVIDADGTLRWGPGNAGTDIFLYRGSASTLRVGGSLLADLTLGAREGQASQTRIGAIGPGAEPGVSFGSAGDSSIYRSAAGTLDVSNALVVRGPNVNVAHTELNTTTSGIGASGNLIVAAGSSATLRFFVGGVAGLEGARIEGTTAIFSVFQGLSIADGKNIALGTVGGTKFGTSAAQKLGFFNAAPVAQPAGIADPGPISAVFVQTEVAELRARIIDVITRLETLGLIATV